MWIDRVLVLEPRRRMVAIKNVSLAEEHLHDHFPGTPVMPASLIIEGMAQTAGILVGHAESFAEKVVLAKVGRAELDEDAVPGDTLRYTAEIAHLSASGASTEGIVELLRPEGTSPAEPRVIGRIDLMFSHVDQNLAGLRFPEHNFVFGEGFRTVLQMSGIDAPGA